MAKSFEFCCSHFENCFSIAGERGISVFARHIGLGAPSFVVQMRTFDVGMEEPLTTTQPATLVGEMVIFKCPWCAKDLEKWYRKNVDSIVRDDLAIGV